MGMCEGCGGVLANEVSFCGVCGRPSGVARLKPQVALQQRAATTSARVHALHPYRITILVASFVSLVGLLLPWSGMLRLNGVQLMFDDHGAPTQITLVALIPIANILLSLIARPSQIQRASVRVAVMLLAVSELLIAGFLYSKLSALGGSPGLYLIAGSSVVVGLVATLGSHWVATTIFVLLTATYFTGGSIHVVRTGDGPKICERSLWSYQDYFEDLVIDVDDYIGKPTTYRDSQALIECGVLTSVQHEEPRLEHRVQTYGTCSTQMISGMCMDASDCDASTMPGLCPGATNIVCCYR